MSEPYSAVAQVTIERARLIAYLDAAPKPARAWTDWSRIGGEWHGFSWERDLPKYLERVDQRLVGSYRQVIDHLIAPDILPGTERCSFEHSSGRFTFATLMLSENLEEILLFFAAARGIAAYMRGDDGGFAVMQDFLWSTEWTLAVMQIAADGRSEFVDSRADAHVRCIGAATAVFEDIRDKGGDPMRVINDLDLLC